MDLTAVDVRDINKNEVNSASAHTFVYILFSVEGHSNRLSSSKKSSVCSTSDSDELSIRSDILRTPHSTVIGWADSLSLHCCLVTYDHAHELDNRLLWTLTENRM